MPVFKWYKSVNILNAISIAKQIAVEIWNGEYEAFCNMKRTKKGWTVLIFPVYRFLMSLNSLRCFLLIWPAESCAKRFISEIWFIPLLWYTKFAIKAPFAKGIYFRAPIYPYLFVKEGLRDDISLRLSLFFWHFKVTVNTASSKIVTLAMRPSGSVQLILLRLSMIILSLCITGAINDVNFMRRSTIAACSRISFTWSAAANGSRSLFTEYIHVFSKHWQNWDRH